MSSDRRSFPAQWEAAVSFAGLVNVKQRPGFNQKFPLLIVFVLPKRGGAAPGLLSPRKLGWEDLKERLIRPVSSSKLHWIRSLRRHLLLTVKC